MEQVLEYLMEQVMLQECWDQIMENVFEYLSDREGHCGHLAEKLQ